MGVPPESGEEPVAQPKAVGIVRVVPEPVERRQAVVAAVITAVITAAVVIRVVVAAVIAVQIGRRADASHRAARRGTIAAGTAPLGDFIRARRVAAISPGARAAARRGVLAAGVRVARCGGAAGRRAFTAPGTVAPGSVVPGTIVPGTIAP